MIDLQYQRFPITVARAGICADDTLRRNHRCRCNQRHLGHIGLAWIFVRISWLSGRGVLTQGHSLIWLTIRYGKEMRAYVNIGYPDFDAQRLHDNDTTTEH